VPPNDREQNKDFFKQMALDGEDLEEFGEAAVESLARNDEQAATESKVELQDADSAASGNGKEDIDEKDVDDEGNADKVRLSGTHKATLKN